MDNCAHQLVKRPEQFDVLVMTNMNGDILSDLSSALVGGLGFAPSANIGSEVAIFEAVHGSAPKYAGKDVINPTALILSAVLMLRYLELFEQADAIEHAVLVTLEDGTLTGDVVGYGNGASTTAYTDAIIANLGRRSEQGGARAPAAAAAQAPGRHRLREADVALRGGDGRLHRVPAGSQRAGRFADGAHARHPAVAEAGLVTRYQGLPADRGDHRHRGPLPVPLHHQGESRRPLRRRRPSAVGGDQPSAPVDAHREAQEFDGELGFTRDQGEN